MIILPSLDTRTWEQLTKEARRELPRLDPKWTDYNVSDPGITMLEAFAWITETALYRADRTPQALQRSFLRLLGFNQLESGIATTVLEVSQTAVGPTLSLPAGLQIGARHSGLVFETRAALTVSAARLIGAWVDAGDGTAPQASPASSGIRPLGHRAVVGSSLNLGFDGLLARPGTRVRLYAWNEGFPADGEIPELLEGERRDWAEACSSHQGPTAHPLGRPAPWREHYSARVVWEYYAGAGRWMSLDGVADDTRALTLSGSIEFDAPPDGGADAHVSGGPEPALFFVRCRLVEGGYDRVPRLLRIGLNTVPVEHSAAQPELYLGQSNGWAREVFDFPTTPLESRDVEVRVHLRGIDQPGWLVRSDLDLSGPFDRHLALDATRGRLKSGDGRQGAPLPADAKIYARRALGGGPAGNGAPGTLSQVLDSARNRALVADPMDLAQRVRITQAFGANGGRPRESIDGARARAVLTLEASEKAVTVADFERLAMSTPGVPLARVWAVPGLHPLLPSVHAAGCVSVIVLPDAGTPAPEPSEPLRRTVARRLELRRLVTTEVHVLGPVYRDLSVTASLRLDRHAECDSVHVAAVAALDSFLDPITGGADGCGWPPGSDVLSADVMATLEAVDGVTGVTTLSFEVGQPATKMCDRVPLCPGELIRTGAHRITLVSSSDDGKGKGLKDGLC